jgi:DNA repair protein REV1
VQKNSFIVTYGCTFTPGKLLAKLAADTVKPNACCVVRDWREFLHSRSLRDIPGIGRKLETKLQPHGLCTVNDIWDLEQDAVSVVGGIIGTGNADKIVRFCYGKDDRPVTPAIRKSIGAECNYGVRFNGPYGVDYMMQGLAKEVHSRMVGAAVRGSKIVLKVMKSKDPSKVPGKFLGHGLCDSFSRSAEMSLTRDKDVIFLAAMKLYEKLAVNDSSVRGIGIVITSLKSDDEVSASNLSPSKLSEWLQKDKSTTVCDGHESRELHETLKQDLFSLPENDLCGTSDCATMPSFSQLDQDVLRNLPENILMEVRATYGHKSSSQTSSNTSLINSSKSRSPGKSYQNDKPIPIAGQASVRRMLKLACVKSGDEQLGSNDLSLSQLDRLPLELQLQLANEDDVKIMKKSKHKINRTIKSDQNDTNHVEILAVGGLQVEERSSGSPEKQCTNFHQDNVLPLQEFISSNPNPDSRAIDKVRDFLSLCVHERKLDDAVIFLRTIKNMSNGWDDNIYSWLRKSTMDEINSRTGDVLDIKWLGL